MHLHPIVYRESRIEKTIKPLFTNDFAKYVCLALASNWLMKCLIGALTTLCGFIP
jgi:hypothetical protein